MTPHELKEQIDIVDIIKKYIQLEKKGQLYWCNCVFHKEKTASFAINKEKKFYNCFGCGVYGDIFSFLMHMENKTFQEVIEDLHHLLGVPYKQVFVNHLNNRIEELLEKACTLYENNLSKDTEALKYLMNRSINQETIKYFRLGYSHENTVIEELIKCGYLLEEIKESGIISYGNMDRFRNRIIFPIINLQNKIIGFGARTMKDEKPKYINSNDNILFHKNITLYHSNVLLIPQKEIYLVEGYMDVIRMYQEGFINTVGGMGTNIGIHQLLLILKKTTTINIFLDGDEAGQKALEKTIILLLSVIKMNYHIYVILIKNQDPDEYLQNSISSINSIRINLWDYIYEKIISDVIYEEDIHKLFYRFDYYIKNIRDNILRTSYSTLWKKKINEFIKKNIKYRSPQLPTTNKEELIIAILLIHPSLIEEFWERISMLQLCHSSINEIKKSLIENTFIPTTYSNNIIKKYQILLSQASFAKKYLIDLICDKNI